MLQHFPPYTKTHRAKFFKITSKSKGKPVMANFFYLEKKTRQNKTPKDLLCTVINLQQHLEPCEQFKLIMDYFIFINTKNSKKLNKLQVIVAPFLNDSQKNLYLKGRSENIRNAVAKDHIPHQEGKQSTKCRPFSMNSLVVTLSSVMS